MNETIDTILARRSVRAYRPDAVPEEYLNKIIECGLFAATARGLQPWHFTVVTDRSLLDRISRACCRAAGAAEYSDNFRGAPCAIIASFEEANPRFGEIDCANAVENMALAACALKLGSCYIASFRMAFETDERDALIAALGIPAGYKPTLSLAVGYAAEVPGERAPRREGTVNWVR